jgi:hypothetical protein
MLEDSSKLEALWLVVEALALIDDAIADYPDDDRGYSRRGEVIKEFGYLDQSR